MFPAQPLVIEQSGDDFGTIDIVPPGQCLHLSEYVGYVPAGILGNPVLYWFASNAPTQGDRQDMQIEAFLFPTPQKPILRAVIRFKSIEC